ncbi:formyltetrahydrofolate deformylase [uncultured Croceitalea sp.]|uniref:formyltetrahydrofolate deformylase n=1 Tax=uncultured Croceitalea sp. TaxID=1798908 RepID=UPI00374F59FF
MRLIILIHCSDQVGIISAVTQFLYNKKGNVIYLDQHVDEETEVFFMRLESEFDSSFEKEDFDLEFNSLIGKPFSMQWSSHQQEVKPRMAIFVSKYNHCLYDLLSRHNSGELLVEIPFILSNHKDLEYIANQFKIPFYHVPVAKETKDSAETEQLRLLKKHKVDFIVLARYMQIVSSRLISAYTNKIINIHHSFLPAFTGAKPYHAAYKRGVKIIGATSHYVTEELDAGPIIEQGVTTVSHSHSVKDFITKGKDLEKIVLSTGVKLHINRKTMVCNNKTVVFT